MSPQRLEFGVGFIGAGVIAKGSFRDPVRGVTTACAVWVSAALGVVAASDVMRQTVSGVACACAPFVIPEYYVSFGKRVALCGGSAIVHKRGRRRVSMQRAVRVALIPTFEKNV